MIQNNELTSNFKVYQYQYNINKCKKDKRHTLKKYLYAYLNFNK